MLWACRSLPMPERRGLLANRLPCKKNRTAWRRRRMWPKRAAGGIASPRPSLSPRPTQGSATTTPRSPHTKSSALQPRPYGAQPPQPPTNTHRAHLRFSLCRALRPSHSLTFRAFQTQSPCFFSFFLPPPSFPLSRTSPSEHPPGHGITADAAQAASKTCACEKRAPGGRNLPRQNFTNTLRGYDLPFSLISSAFGGCVMSNRCCVCDEGHPSRRTYAATKRRLHAPQPTHSLSLCVHCTSRRA